MFLTQEYQDECFCKDFPGKGFPRLLFVIFTLHEIEAAGTASEEYELRQGFVLGQDGRNLW
jgi:hypothetical protein